MQGADAEFIERLRQACRQERLHADGGRELHHAAVLVPVVFEATGPELLFTRRTLLVETHKGQISFPGGVVDPNDRDVIAAALRETEEELGIPADAVEPLGLLDDLTTPTGFVITPVVGILRPGTPFRPNEAEVAEVFSVPLRFFAEPGGGHSMMVSIGGRLREVWSYDHRNHLIWGATASIIRSLLGRMGLLQDASASSDGTKRRPTE